MDEQSEKITSLPPPATCSFKRSYVKVSSQEFNSGNMPQLLSRRDSLDFSRRAFELKNRPESPLPFFRLKFSDSSSGYGSSNSFSSGLHSIQRTPSLHCLSHPPQQITFRRMDRPSKAQIVRDSITNVLDQIDKRVAFLRETALELEEEKKKLHRVLNSIIASEELSTIEDVEQEEIKVTTHGLLYRLNSVDITLITPRSETQLKALENVNLFIEKLCQLIKTNPNSAKQICQSYLSSCSSDHFRSVPIDDKFQKAIIQCAVDDQKEIRKKLENLFSSLAKLEMQQSN